MKLTEQTHWLWFVMLESVWFWCLSLLFHNLFTCQRAVLRTPLCDWHCHAATTPSTALALLGSVLLPERIYFQFAVYYWGGVISTCYSFIWKVRGIEWHSYWKWRNHSNRATPVHANGTTLFFLIYFSIRDLIHSSLVPVDLSWIFRKRNGWTQFQLPLNGSE